MKSKTITLQKPGYGNYNIRISKKKKQVNWKEIEKVNKY